MKLLRGSFPWYKSRSVGIEEQILGIINISYRHLSKSVSASKQECILDSCSINPSCKEPRVIIVGAGMAGLSAASRLTQCGIRNFLVLEAKERYFTKIPTIIDYFKYSLSLLYFAVRIKLKLVCYILFQYVFFQTRRKNTLLLAGRCHY